MIRIGEFNYCVGEIGIPGCGKSSDALNELHKRLGNHYIVAFDPDFSLPNKLHDGRKSEVYRYETCESLLAGLDSCPRGIHAINTNVEDAINCARIVAASSIAGKQEGQKAVPTILYIDEIAEASGMSHSYIKPEIRTLITGRRHKHIGILWTGQSARICHNSLLGLSTELRIYRLIDAKDYRRLSELNIISEADWKIIAPDNQTGYEGLPRFTHLSRKKGEWK